VQRIDKADGEKQFFQYHKSGESWIKGFPEEKRKELPVYNYDAVRLAIANGETVWIVEGESCVEALRSLGIPATTTIGGSSSLERYGDYSKDLEGANIILCPDRDDKGVAYMAHWAALYPSQVVGYYLAGSEGLWSHPGGGMDIGDDIIEQGYGVEQLLRKVSHPDRYREIVQPVVMTQGQLASPASEDNEPFITEIQSRSLSDFLAAGEVSDFDPHLYFPERLANLLVSDGEIQCVDPVGYVPAILSAVSSLMGHTWLDVGSHRIPNVLWTMIVQGSGGGKSRIDTLVFDTIRKWEVESSKQYALERKVYDTNLNNAGKGRNFADFDEDPPVRRRYMLGNATISAVEQAVCLNAGSSFLWTKEELPQILKSFNRFSQGDSGDLETFLEFWGGQINIIDRLDVKRSLVSHGSRISLCGGIQPGQAYKIFDRNDYQGLLARFVPFFPGDCVRVAKRTAPEMGKELPAIYQSVNSRWQPIRMSDTTWEDFWAPSYNYLVSLRSSIPAYQNWMNKSPDHFGRLAIALHAIECHYDPSKALWEIDGETLARAYRLVLFLLEGMGRFCRSLDGVTPAAGEVSSDERVGILSPELVRIMNMLSLHPEGIQPRDIYQGSKAFLTLSKEEGLKPSDLAKKCCEDLHGMGLATWNGKTLKPK
jgi:hypothetical protein